jgi:tetratricopeptide (TPR) repeat protein
MYRSSLFLTAALIGTTIALVQPAAAAKSVSEVEAIARSVAVEIKLQKYGSVGSGVIINKKGDLYTLVTNEHVVCGNRRCSELPSGESYNLGLSDGQQYRVRGSSIRLLSDGLDLAIIQFRSSRNYAVAKVTALGSLKANEGIYVVGFPSSQPGFAFNAGGTIAVVNKRLKDDGGGYTIIYDATTLPGMSGGGVFDGNGELVAIHGQGTKYNENTDFGYNSSVGSKVYRKSSKTGFNRGIPIRWLVQNLAEEGINLGTARSISGIRAARFQVPTTADEFFISGFNKFVDPGDSVVAGKKEAIQELSMAIRLNSEYAVAYYLRAIIYEQIQDFKKALEDYDKAISIHPGAFLAYHNRAILKAENFSDYPGALKDYDQAVLINPAYAPTYYSRGVLKQIKLDDIEGAFNDYTQAISINPRFPEAYQNRAILKYTNREDIPGAFSDCNQAISINSEYAEAYMLRGILKASKRNDRTGAIQDFRQAARLFREQGNTQNLQLVIGVLQQLGATE